MNRIFNTVRGRILASFLVMGLLLLGGVSYIAQRQSAAALLSSAEAEGQAAVGALREGFEQYLSARSAFIEAAAGHAETRSGDLERQKAFLSSLNAGNLQIQAYFIIDMNGDGHYLDGKVNKLGDREYFTRARDTRKTVVGQPVVSRATGETVVIVASPVFGEKGDLLSVLCGRITAATLTDLAARQKWGEGGSAMITDANGLFIVHPDAEYIGAVNAAQGGEGVPEGLSSAVKLALAGEQGIVYYSEGGSERVAEEVRTLAEESNRAAAEVGKVIGDISGKTENAKADQENSVEQIRNLVARARETKSVIDDVILKVASITDNIQSLAAAMEQQSAAAGEMATGMDHAAKAGGEIADQVADINRSMDEQGRMVESVAAAASELVDLSSTLQRSVARFRTGA